MISSLAADSCWLHCRGTQPGLNRRCIAPAPGFLPGQEPLPMSIALPCVSEAVANNSHSACVARRCQCNVSVWPLPSSVVTAQLKLVGCKLPTSSCPPLQSAWPQSLLVYNQLRATHLFVVEQAAVDWLLTETSHVAMQGGCCAGPGTSAGGSSCGHLPLQGCRRHEGCSQDAALSTPGGSGALCNAAPATCSCRQEAA